MKFQASELKYRSALDYFPTNSVPKQPTVAIVIPTYNEIANIECVAKDVHAQDYPRITEIWFVDGLSNDGTFQSLQRLQSNDDRVRVVTNPKRLPAAAMNLALASVQCDIVIRLDAHARYETDVVTQSVSALLDTGAGGVGSAARPAAAQTIVGCAIVAAHKSRLGVGVAKFRQETAEGWADSVWNGCYWMHVVRQVGPLREDLWRAEDNDFNERVRRLGYGLYLSPEIRASYQPRQSFQALWNQYFCNGIATALALPENPRAFSLRHLVPMAFVLCLILPLAMSALWPSMLFGFVGVLGLYFTGLLAATIVSFRAEPGVHVLLLPFALMTLHLSYGIGSLWGFALHVHRAILSPKTAIESSS